MASIGIFVHDLGSREIRVRFDIPVSEAESFTYVLTSIGGYVPSIVDVSFYDADNTSIKIKLDAALTRGQTYSCQVLNGSPVTTVPFDFLATDKDIPHVLGAYQSLRGCVDVICDRPVATTSVAATANLAPAGGGLPVAMTLVPWAAGQSLNAVRFSYAAAPVDSEFVVQYADVVDISGNTCDSGQVSLTLAYSINPLTSYADLTQAGVISARVADVSNAEGFATAVLRVFFNCPMSGADVISPVKWTIAQSGAHVAPDAINVVSAPDATDDPSMIVLVNDEKAKFNAHLISHAHLVTDSAHEIITPDAVDIGTARMLLSEIEIVLTDHYDREDLHFYADHVHPVGSGASYADANTLKTAFNKHLTGSYGLAFSNAYSPVGPIVNFASSANASVTSDQFTWFADLHMATDATKASFSVGFIGINSEDAGSVATGTVMADPAEKTPGVVSVARFFRGATIRLDCEAEMLDVDAARLRDSGMSTISTSIAAPSNGQILPQPVIFVESTAGFPPSGSFWIETSMTTLEQVDYTGLSGGNSFTGCTGGVGTMSTGGSINLISAPSAPRVVAVSSTSLPALLWAFNNVLQAYRTHIDSFSWLGAGHKSPDPDVVAPGDYATIMDLALLIAKANAFKTRLTTHMTAPAYHYNPDAGVDAVDAFDMASLENLIIDMRVRLSRHNSSGFIPGPYGTLPSAPIYHGYPGVGIVSAVVHDLIVVTFDGAMNGNILEFSTSIVKSWQDNRPSVVTKSIPGSVEEFFAAVDDSPSLTAAVARPGYSPARAGPYLLTDAVELYLSKPMRNQALTLGTNIIITGSPISTINAEWLNDRTIFVQVTNMLAAVYSVDAPGLRDVAGNLIG